MLLVTHTAAALVLLLLVVSPPVNQELLSSTTRHCTIQKPASGLPRHRCVTLVSIT